MKFREREIKIPSIGVELTGTATMPDGAGPFACMILAGGSLSDTRDGKCIGHDDGMPCRDALKRLAHVLANAGYASLRWDKRAYSAIPPCDRPTNNRDDTDDLMAAMAFARNDPAFSKIVVFGESAGAYFAGLAAKHGVYADAYVFLGALCSSNDALFEYNYGQLYDYARRSEENMRWAESVSRNGLAVGKSYREILDAARNGADSYKVRYKDRAFDYRLERQREELADTPQDLFGYIKSPSLILHGVLDMNVPPVDAETAEAIMRKAGNDNVTRIMIPDADHSFQMAPRDLDARIRERHSFESFRNPYSPVFDAALLDWLKKNV